ncbi:hypothetical protein MN116_002782 [Schistosoma mekongi]|uniref:Voltage-gated potassium channel n=1 Tax=Schistosoma mekongi TaxID=38744 RepID=A0AAE2D6W0_SCHME|nr:hypothetical protein MN116_002782 [Schistosoma mekongi]
MSQHKGLSTPQNKFLETIVARSDALHANFVLGNAQRKYYPIVYCSDGFLLLTNYSRANVMSRSSVCQFLWGSETIPTVRMEINQAFHNHYEYRNRVVFYTRTGEPFTCDFTVTPIRNEKSEVVLFLCSYQRIPNDLLHSNVDQSIFKINPSKLYSIHSWASELPFSKSYLQIKHDNFEEAVEDDETNLQRLKYDVNITQASSPKDTCPYKVLSNPTIASHRTDKHFLNITETVCPTTLSTSYSCQTLLKEPRIETKRNSYNMQSDFQNETNTRYPTKYYLPSYCQPTSFGDIRQEPTSNTTSQQISRTFNKCTCRNFSSLSLPQIKSQLRNFKHRKIKEIASEKVNNKRIYDFKPNSSERSQIVSYRKLRTTNSYKHSRMITNKNSEVIENDRKISFWKSFDYLPYSSILSNQSVYSEPNKDDIEHLTITDLQQKNLKIVNQSPCAFKTETNNETTSSESGGESKQDKAINCFSCISQRLSDSRSYPYGNISKKICEPDPKKYSYKRRKSLALIHGLRFRGRKIRKTNSSKFNRQIKNFSGKNVPDYKIQKLTKSNFVLLHYGLFRIIWDWLLLILTFYIAFIVPYNVTFESHSTHSGRCRIIDLIVEIFLIVDVILNFHTTYVNKSGQIVNNRQLIAKHYAKGWLILDVLAALPVDFILIFFQITSIINLEDIKINTNLIETMNISLLQMMKLARLLRLARLIQKIIRLSQYSVIVLGLLMFSFALVAHWCACIWYVIGLYEIDDCLHSFSSKCIGWLEDLARRLRSPFHLNRSGGPTEGSKYFTALYFTCSSLTSVGFGNVSANTTNEKIFAICIMLLGALMHAAVFGNVTAIIQRMYARRTTFQSKVQDLKEFIEVHRIPKTLKSRMQDFFQTTWAINRGIDVPEVLKIYPEELQGDIYLHLNREVLGLKVFEKASRDCLKSLAINFKLTFCTPGEYLIHTGDILRRLYFVSNGSLEVLERDEVVALLGKNDWFGAFVDSDIPIIRSRCDVKSLTYCDLHYIDLITLSEILNQHPRFKAELKSYLYEDLSFNIQEGADTFFSNDVITVPAITLQLANDDKDWENSESNLSIIEDVESLKPPQFIFDNKGRSCSLTTYDVESGLLKSHSNNQSNSELSFTKSTSALTTPKISRINEKRLQFRSPSLVTEQPSHYPRRLQSSDKIVTRRRFFLLKSSKSLGSSSNADLTQKIKEKHSSSLCFKPTEKLNDTMNHKILINNFKLFSPKQSRRHTVPTVIVENSKLKTKTTSIMNSHDESNDRHHHHHHTEDSWIFSNHSSGTQSNDEFCLLNIPSTQCLSYNYDKMSRISNQSLSIPNVNLSHFTENTQSCTTVCKSIGSSMQLTQFNSFNCDINTISTSNLCLYTPNTSPVNSIWSCTNDYNHHRFTSSNRVYIHGSSFHEINLTNELHSLNNRLDYIELQITKLFKLRKKHNSEIETECHGVPQNYKDILQPSICEKRLQLNSNIPWSITPKGYYKLHKKLTSICIPHSSGKTSSTADRVYKKIFFENPSNGIDGYTSSSSSKSETTLPDDINPCAVFCTKSFSRFDVDQGALGDCWFNAVLATITRYPSLMRNIVPSNQNFSGPNYLGAVKFNF